MKRYTNKYSLRPWFVKSVLVIDHLIDIAEATLREIVIPAFAVATACGGIAVALLKITGVIA